MYEDKQPIVIETKENMNKILFNPKSKHGKLISKPTKASNYDPGSR
jgi:hypothetical protein